MSEKQRIKFNQMRNALIQISSHYQTPAQLERGSGDQYGLDYTEALEMAYENIQDLAKQSVKGVKFIPDKTALTASDNKEGKG